MPTRDPDKLLEAFAQLTARDSGQFVPSSTRSPIVRGLATATVALILIGTVGGLAVTYGPRLAPGGDGQAIEMITHRMTDISIAGQHTGIAGIPVTEESDCLYLSVADGHHWLAIWPTGTTVDESEDPPIIRDAGGNRITRIGDDFSLTGTSFGAGSKDVIQPYLDREIPERCLGTEFLLIEPGVSALAPEVATWRLDPAVVPDPTTTTLHIQIHENTCSSRRDPTGRTLPPQIAYGADKIVITMSVLEIGGRCPENPYFPMTIQLAEPIGDRSLVDGYDSGVRWTAAANAPEPTTTPQPTATPLVAPTPESQPASWEVDGAAEIGPESTSVRLLVRHDLCQLDYESIGALLPPEIEYHQDAVVISTRVSSTAKLTSCEDVREGGALVPALVELAEPLGERGLADGVQDPPAIRWQSPPADAVRLPTVQSEPWPLGFAFMDGLCSDIGLSDAFIAGAPDDPRLVWIENGQGQSGPSDRWVWPAGYTVRFSHGVEVLNPAGTVVHRDGDPVDGACVGRDSSGDVRCLCGLGYLILDPDARAIQTALVDPLLADYLAQNPHGRATASAYLIPRGTQPSTPATLVSVRFEGFADDYPLGSCDIYREIDRPIGAAWLIDLEADEILARSPIWPGEIDCFPNRASP